MAARLARRRSNRRAQLPRESTTHRTWTPRSLAARMALVATVLLPHALPAQETAPGKEVYDRWCAGCHGVDGAGAGPGATTMLPRPRDFTRALYQVRTTASGQLPTDEDIMRVIDEGMPGTAMPGWEDFLSRAEREALVEYLKSFSRFFSGPAPAPLQFGSAPGVNEERTAEGQRLYQEIECWRCHGQTGRGDGASAPTLDDDQGLPIVARDLTRSWLFNGGARVEDIFRTLMTGLDGTPMPTFTDIIDAGIIPEDQLWSMAQYVASLSPDRPPQTREVIGVALVEEVPLPSSADDEAWETVERYYVPMVGQIVVAPRWFNPRVDGIWVQGLHDGQELALRLSWTDPSQSPDSAWTEYATNVRTSMEPHDDGADWQPGAPDRVIVQFPQQLPLGLERPAFLQGDVRRPAYLWEWSSEQTGPRELVATGLGTGVAQSASSVQLATDASWGDGEWRVLFRRSLATPDSAADLQFPVAQDVPIAFQAWDGDNGEAGKQGSISTWYFVQLQERTPVTVYVAPALAMMLTAGLGMLVVLRAQKREREGQTEAAPGGDDHAEAPA